MNIHFCTYASGCEQHSAVDKNECGILGMDKILGEERIQRSYI